MFSSVVAGGRSTPFPFTLTQSTCLTRFPLRYTSSRGPCRVLQLVTGTLTLTSPQGDANTPTSQAGRFLPVDIAISLPPIHRMAHGPCCIHRLPFIKAGRWLASGALRVYGCGILDQAHQRTQGNNATIYACILLFWGIPHMLNEEQLMGMLRACTVYT
ncbi:hypothetical protein BDN67DRAFT_121893 [Paxillus ammoniavirescens]|nr:hypothetical protein BDN67DRAFT_121893 [Paxillus ammoniavirescens]